jgi:hypothetical protein
MGKAEVTFASDIDPASVNEIGSRSCGFDGALGFYGTFFSTHRLPGTTRLANTSELPPTNRPNRSNRLQGVLRRAIIARL